MALTATLTSKGQITIPKEVRVRLGLRTGDRLAFEVQGESEAVVRPLSASVDEVFGMLRRPGRKPLTLKEMDAAVRRRMAAQYRR